MPGFPEIDIGVRIGNQKKYLLNPLVSICVPNLNKRPFLPERMETLLAQTVKDWEILVCDSFSDDGSWEFFQKFKDDRRVRLHQVPRHGLYAGWNECLARATGRFVVFATSDDTAEATWLEKLVGLLLQHPDTHLAVCGFSWIDCDSCPRPAPGRDRRQEFIEKYCAYPSRRAGLTEFLLHSCFTTFWFTMAAVMFERQLLDRVGLFRTDRGSSADLEWSYRAALASDVIFIPEKLVTFRINPQQSTDFSGGRVGMKPRMDCLRGVLSDPHSGIPDEWRRVPNWQERIGAAMTMEYHDAFHLHRGQLVAHPVKFVRAALDALRVEPGLLLDQALRGFRWEPSRFNPDCERLALELIELFGAPWPPAPINC